MRRWYRTRSRRVSLSPNAYLRYNSRLPRWKIQRIEKAKKKADNNRHLQANANITRRKRASRKCPSAVGYVDADVEPELKHAGKKKPSMQGTRLSFWAKKSAAHLQEYKNELKKCSFQFASRCPANGLSKRSGTQTKSWPKLFFEPETRVHRHTCISADPFSGEISHGTGPRDGVGQGQGGETEAGACFTGDDVTFDDGREGRGEFFFFYTFCLHPQRLCFPYSHTCDKVGRVTTMS